MPQHETQLREDEAAVEAGLDALDTPAGTARGAARRDLLRQVLAPVVALVAIVGLWQFLWSRAIWPEFQLPAPLAVWDQIQTLIDSGQVWEFLWVSVHRAVIGFLISLAVATPLGLLLAKVRLFRAAFGPLISGLQSLPSVAWVPAAVLWFGLTDATIYTVVLLGAVPSIANGLVAGIDQIPPILPRVGKVLGAGRIDSARYILLPAALPGYLAGMKQGWAFSWRSLMAAELIATSPQLGFGLGQYLHNGMALSDMSMVMAGILLIFFVGVGIELLLFRPLERSVLRSRGLTGAH
ncbi:NitT/TauT family transport system permease protein [Actinokineospora alba]|uniref:NitT/TauT family transport system permease protein n=1 Tax=Actinokineospora alba TaxID=504798 RepID=A0A1H0K7R9_9PSEU|nr:ABC transporter permease [Actinokineospora alba]TDP68016.1 NitT/TauT family transport system permease protein [Actinokineospora alba]SDH90762.1 NitT/TauT family transport system permease protein [Actinokineospora alba]SDO51823.1 NitT/TauT family transport system permease protein [Actinokineospora alba]